MELEEELVNCTVKDIFFRELKTEGKEINIADLTIDQTKEFVLSKFGEEDPMLQLELDEETEKYSSLMINGDSS